MYNFTPKLEKAVFDIQVYLQMMIQDHNITNQLYVCNEYTTFSKVYDRVKAMKEVLDREGTYTEIDREFLNEVRNLVLHWKKGTLMDCPQYIDLPF